MNDNQYERLKTLIVDPVISQLSAHDEASTDAPADLLAVGVALLAQAIESQYRHDALQPLYGIARAIREANATD